jgi:hypothetical protein
VDFRMGKPTFDNGIPRPGLGSPEPRGFGLPLSKEGMRSLNKIGGFKLTRGTETSQYPEERTSTETPLVVASERGPGQWRMQDNRNPSGKRNFRG